MSGKVRCARCGKTFKPGRSSQTLCDQCEKQERAARAAARGSGASGAVRAPTASAAPVRIVGPAASLLDPTASPGVTTSAPPPDTGPYGSAAIREEQRREQQRREEQRHAEERARDEQRARERAQRFAEQHTHDAHHDHHDHHGQPRPAKPASRGPQPAAAPRPPKPPRPATPQFVMTDELRATIEARYLELAQPVEFDGIRTRIAAELSVPKSHVKQAIAALRARMQLPSWWELQSYSGAETDLERIRMAYLPHLPVPAVGIHKTLADDLQLDPRTVYQGIRRIRAEMRLPQYNAPELHGDLPRDAQAAADATPGSEAQPAQPAQPVEAMQAASAERRAEQESPSDEARM